MAYQMYDVHGNEISYHDLQDKSPWCRHGESKENSFINQFGSQLQLDINPDKTYNRFSPDLINLSNNRLGDLKTQNTPFFSTNDPQYNVVFNEKDKDRYDKYYPDIEIYFWVDWIAVRYKNYDREVEVQPMSGVWYVHFHDLKEIIRNAPLHQYQQRKHDTRGNAKASYIINLNHPLIRKIV